MDTLRFELEYEWESFTVQGQHLTFAQLCDRKLFPNECSHWGAAVYKWEGILTLGPYSGRLGIHIGETESIQEQIQRYSTATSEQADLYRYRAFLSHGDVRLFIFKLVNATLGVTDPKSVFGPGWMMPASQRRVMYQQLLVTKYSLENPRYVVFMP